MNQQPTTQTAAADILRYRVMAEQVVSNDGDVKVLCVFGGQRGVGSLIAEATLKRYRDAIGKGVVLDAWIEPFEL